MSQTLRHSVLYGDHGAAELLEFLQRADIHWTVKQLSHLGGNAWTAHLVGDRHLAAMRLAVREKLPQVTNQDLAEVAVQVWAARHRFRFAFRSPARFVARADVDRELAHMAARRGLAT